MRFAPILPLLLVVGCAQLTGGAGAVEKSVMQAHADACVDIASENSKYVAADTSLADSQKAIRVARNNDTAAFAKKLAEASK